MRFMTIWCAVAQSQSYNVEQLIIIRNNWKKIKSLTLTHLVDNNANRLCSTPFKYELNICSYFKLSAKIPLITLLFCSSPGLQLLSCLFDLPNLYLISTARTSCSCYVYTTITAKNCEGILFTTQIIRLVYIVS